MLANIDHSLFTLADYPVLSALADTRTKAKRLDGRACRYFYATALDTIDPTVVSAQEIALMRVLGVDLPGHVNLAAVTNESGELVARLSGGRELRHRDAEALADLLLAEGIIADDLRMPDWRAGDIAPGTGERVAIFSRMGRAQRGTL